ncbi:cyclin-dependent kinase inhibitor 1B isoform X1 [Pyrgilauda ruficollis]|uniref:cyclin-dependent kinase inhibitor 1B isoform X1 n=1 Tax=Pyrgilauda ruficollis TaxID=221976 RepID=UPI001B86C238|nr:cyclin-dependent kinase inhibitor 1B isoform X1 [Pyrgilauda ruficollis]XP_041341865.1 cyclin-dependent kinase inhibitor 1B isoform X1 [Pyrgilauda ruficollis]
MVIGNDVPSSCKRAEFPVSKYFWGLGWGWGFFEREEVFRGISCTLTPKASNSSPKEHLPGGHRRASASAVFPSLSLGASLPGPAGDRSPGASSPCGRSWLSKMAPRTPRARQMPPEAPAALRRGRAGPGAGGHGQGWHRTVQEGMPAVRGMAGAARPCPPRPPRCERTSPPGDAGEQRSQPQGLRGINKHVKEHRTGAEGEHSSLRGSPGSNPLPGATRSCCLSRPRPGSPSLRKLPENAGMCRAGAGEGRREGARPRLPAPLQCGPRLGQGRAEGPEWVRPALPVPCSGGCGDRWTHRRPPRARSVPALLPHAQRLQPPRRGCATQPAKRGKHSRRFRKKKKKTTPKNKKPKNKTQNP